MYGGGETNINYLLETTRDLPNLTESYILIRKINTEGNTMDEKKREASDLHH